MKTTSARSLPNSCRFRPRAPSRALVFTAARVTAAGVLHDHRLVDVVKRRLVLGPCAGRGRCGASGGRRTEDAVEALGNGRTGRSGASRRALTLGIAVYNWPTCRQAA